MRDAVLATAGAVLGFFIGALVVSDANRDAFERGYAISKGKLYLIEPAKPVVAP